MVTQRVTTDEAVVLGNTSNSNSGDEVAATTSIAGVAQLATIADVTAGSDDALVVTPDSLGGLPRSFAIAVFDSITDCAIGNGIIAFCVPAFMGVMNITDVVATVHTAGVDGTMNIQIRRRRGPTDADMLSVVLTIDSTDESSIDAATAHTIGANDDLLEGDLIYIDVDAVHTTTAAKGLTVTVTAAEP